MFLFPIVYALEYFINSDTCKIGLSKIAIVLKTLTRELMSISGMKVNVCFIVSMFCLFRIFSLFVFFSPYYDIS